MESQPNLFNGCVQLVEKPFILLILTATCVNHPQHAQGNILKEQFNVMAESRFAPSQAEMLLLCNGVSHWLGTSLESALNIIPCFIKIEMVNNITHK